MRHSWIALALIVFGPSIVLAAAPKTLKELASLIVTILNSATSVLVLAGIVIYLLGGSFHLWRANERGTKVLVTYLTWGLVVIFVMVSIWGILALLQATFGFGSPYQQGGIAPTAESSNTVPQPQFPPVQGFE